MPDINQLIQKLNEYIEKGRAGKKNDPWDIQWHVGRGEWVHRHANWNGRAKTPHGPLRGNWHTLEMAHPSLGEGHDNYLKFERAVLFGGIVPKDTKSQILTQAVREKYGVTKPTEKEYNDRIVMEGFDDSKTWSPDKIPSDLRDQFMAGTPPEAQQEITRRDVGESKRPSDVEEEKDIEDATEESDKPIEEVIPEERDWNKIYRDEFVKKGYEVKDIQGATFIAKKNSEGNYISDIFITYSVTDEGTGKTIYKVLAFKDKTLKTPSDAQDDLSISYPSIKSAFMDIGKTLPTTIKGRDVPEELLAPEPEEGEDVEAAKKATEILLSPVNVDNVFNKLQEFLPEKIWKVLQNAAVKLKDDDITNLTNRRSILYRGIKSEDVRDIVFEAAKKVIMELEAPIVKNVDGVKQIKEKQNISNTDKLINNISDSLISEGGGKSAKNILSQLMSLGVTNKHILPLSVAINEYIIAEAEEKKAKGDARYVAMEKRSNVATKINNILENMRGDIQQEEPDVETQVVDKPAAPVKEIKELETTTPQESASQPTEEETAEEQEDVNAGSAEKEEEAYTAEQDAKRAKNPKQYDTELVNRIATNLGKTYNIPIKTSYDVIKVPNGREYFKFESGDTAVYAIRNKPYSKSSDSSFIPAIYNAAGKLQPIDDSMPLDSVISRSFDYLRGTIKPVKSESATANVPVERPLLSLESFLENYRREVPKATVLVERLVREGKTDEALSLLRRKGYTDQSTAYRRLLHWSHPEVLKQYPDLAAKAKPTGGQVVTPSAESMGTMVDRVIAREGQKYIDDMRSFLENVKGKSSKEIEEMYPELKGYIKPPAAEKKEEIKKPTAQEQLINHWKDSFTNKKLEFKQGTLGDTNREKYNIVGVKPNIQYVILKNGADEENDFKKYTLYEVDKSKTTPEEQNQELDYFDDLNTAFNDLWKYIYPKEKVPVQKSGFKANEVFSFLDNYKKMAEKKLPDDEIDIIFKTLFSQLLKNTEAIYSFGEKHNINNKIDNDVAKFRDAKDRIDKVVAIDAFVHLSHQNKGLLRSAFAIEEDDIIDNRINNILTQLSLDNDTWRMQKQIADGGGPAVAADSFTPTFGSGKQKRINFFATK